MVSSARQAIACIVVIFGVAAAAHAQITPSKESGATISGRVTLKGKGMAGIIVTLRGGGDRFRSGREYSGPKGVTDDDGNYQIVNVPPGTYRAVPAARAFVPGVEADREKVLIVSKSETIEHIDFAMLRGGVITGRVVDPEGRPVVEESVYVVAGAETGNPYAQSYTQTDDRGVYRVYGLRPGSYRVVAGRGEDSFQGGNPRPYRRTYYPSANDPLEASVVEVSEGSESKDIDITFNRTVTTYSASGRVVETETGQPVPNINYGVTRFEDKGSSSMSGGAVTNSRGEFKLENLSPGKYSVNISTSTDTDLQFEVPKFEIVDSDVKDIVVKGTKSGSISGVVVFEGLDEKTAREQLGQAWISATLDGSPNSQTGSSSRLGPDGSFHLRGVAGGTASIYVYTNGNLRVDRIERDGVVIPGRSISLNEREHVKGIRVIAQVGNASLRGNIVVENGTLPADHRFFIWARKIGDDSRETYGGSMMRPQVDSRGQFVIEGMTPGTYELTAGVGLTSAKQAYLAAKQQVVVTAGTPTTVTITVDLNSTPIKQP